MRSRRCLDARRDPLAPEGEILIKLMIPGFGPLEIRRVVTDYTGTHSFKGVVRRTVRTRLARLARLVEVHVLTVDTFGTARRELARLPVELHFLNDDDRRNDKEKQRFVLKYEPKHVAAFGNGNYRSAAAENCARRGRSRSGCRQRRGLRA